MCKRTQPIRKYKDQKMSKYKVSLIITVHERRPLTNGKFETEHIAHTRLQIVKNFLPPENDSIVMKTYLLALAKILALGRDVC